MWLTTCYYRNTWRERWISSANFIYCYAKKQYEHEQEQHRFRHNGITLAKIHSVKWMCIWKKLYWDRKCVLIWSILNRNKNFPILRCLSHQSYCLFLINMKTTSVSENCFYFDRLPMNNLSGLSRIIIFVKVWNIAHTALQNYNRPN